MNRFPHLSVLLLWLLPCALSMPSIGHGRRSVGSSPHAAAIFANLQCQSKTEEDNKEEERGLSSALESEAVPLPRLSDDNKSSFWQRRSFDIVRLPPPSQKSRKSRQSPKGSRKITTATCGTRFGLRTPTSERITLWFAPRDQQRATKDLFNHDSVGMTNPVLSVGTGRDKEETSQTEVSLASSTTTADDSGFSFELEDSWIQTPAVRTSSTTSQQQPSAQIARVLQYKRKPQDDGAAWFPETYHDKRKWRLCRFRRRVGQGQACYERVREAALEWQFRHETSNLKGILPVNPFSAKSSSSSSNCFSLAGDASQKVHPIWSGPHTAGSRRLVTYTTTGFKSRWLPKLYTFNPVMVVYDLLDQRGPATTYTSTAYATLKGHLLSGEERVTVALRDSTGFVDVEVLSYSRPASSLKAKLIWPFIGRMQSRFFEDQMDYLEQVAMPKQ